MEVVRGYSRVTGMDCVWRCAVLLLILAIGCAVAQADQPGPATPPPANIVFVDAAAVTLSPDSSGNFQLDTAVKNAGGRVGIPSFHLLSVNKGSNCSKPLDPDPGLGAMQPNATLIAHFTISGVALPTTCYIELATKAPTTEASGTKEPQDNPTNTSLKQIKLSQTYVRSDVMWAFFGCLLLGAAVMGIARFAIWANLGSLPVA